MRNSLAVALAVILSASVASAAASSKKGSAGPKVTRPAPGAHAHSTPKAPKATGGQRPATVSHRGATAKTTHGRSTAHVTRTPATAGTATATSATTIPTSLPRNPKLVARLQSLLPPGTDINVAAQGFRNQGQFVAAVHVSRNLDIPFASLKTKMVDEGLSLGQAIQSLRSTADATTELRRAHRQASEDLNTRTTTKTKRSQ